MPGHGSGTEARGGGMHALSWLVRQDHELTTGHRPLPVERSQGSVSALVARFQTAANRNKDSAARTESRRASLQPQPGSIRRTSYGPGTPLPDEGAGVVDGGGDKGFAKGLNKVFGVDAGKGDKKEAERQGGAGVSEKGLNGGAEGVGEVPVNGKGVQKEPAGELKAVTAEEPKAPVEAKQATPKKTLSAAPSPAQPTTTSPTVPSPAPTTAHTTPKPKATTPAPSKPTATRTPSSTAAPRASTSGSGSTIRRAASQRSTPSASTATSPPSAHTAKPLTPSITGPARHTRPASSMSPPAAAGSPSPLKPHLTGTPSKPTASFLAKTKSPPSGQAGRPEEKPRQSSVGRAAGARVSAAGASPQTGRKSLTSPSPASGAGTGRSASRMSTPAAHAQASAPGSGEGKKTGSLGSSSGSRLMQGTAASRARAAASQAHSPSGTPSKPATTAGVKVKSPPSTLSRATSARRTSANGATGAGGKAKADPAEQPPIPPVGRNPIGRLGLAGAGMKRAEGPGTEAGEKAREEGKVPERKAVEGGELPEKNDEGDGKKVIAPDGAVTAVHEDGTPKEADKESVSKEEKAEEPQPKNEDVEELTEKLEGAGLDEKAAADAPEVEGEKETTVGDDGDDGHKDKTEH
ncbi:hypothetical protein IAT38_002592 [Cryptococcus sp. DSM 104549]